MILRVTVFLALLIVLIEAKKFNTNDEKHKQWEEFEEFLEWKKWKEQEGHERKENKEGEWAIGFENKPRAIAKPYEKREEQNPPPPGEAALMARYIVNQVDWTAVATISTRRDILTFPTVNLVSFSDGAIGNGSGIPYLYLTPLDFTAQDLAKDSRATLLMSLAEGNYCKDRKWDPMDPRCARIMLTGKIKAIKNESVEIEVAKAAVFNRHPRLQNMPADHHFYFAKLKIMTIALLDTFGGPKYIPVKEYLHPASGNITEELIQHFYRKYDHETNLREGFDIKPTPNYLNPIVHHL